eukprot:TRINITY_DN3082_c0_g1_i2.p1 TRINITY_DN3082_c0_g1~~TRINITY_DN3082_c0_g1_i2.p1  ORF type:complete len:194 (+),score=47.75 TRINITY_DN3082_c0_g1_i2:213-794(+)
MKWRRLNKHSEAKREAHRRNKLNDCISELAELTGQQENKDKCSVLSNVASRLESVPRSVHSMAQGAAHAMSIAKEAVGEMCGAAKPQVSVNDMWQHEPIGMIFLAISLKLLDVNKWLLNKLGYQDSVPVSILTVVHPDSMPAALSAAGELVTGAKSVVFTQGRLVHSNGDTSWWFGRGEIVIHDVHGANLCGS